MVFEASLMLLVRPSSMFARLICFLRPYEEMPLTRVKPSDSPIIYMAPLLLFIKPNTPEPGPLLSRFSCMEGWCDIEFE